MPNQIMIVQYKDGRIHAHPKNSPDLISLWDHLEEIKSVVYADVQGDIAAPTSPILEEPNLFVVMGDIPFNKFCKGLRIWSGYSQQKMAEIMGTNQTIVSQFERSKKLDALLMKDYLVALPFLTQDMIVKIIKAYT